MERFSKLPLKHKKTQEERKAIIKKAFHERKAAFDMLAKNSHL